MKIFKKNKMFLFFKEFGLFSGGSLGIYYQKYFPLMSLIYISHNLKNIQYFFTVKRQLKLFQKFINIAQYYLQLGCFLEVKIHGIGYKCWRFKQDNLLFDLGYSHFILYKNIYNIFFRLSRMSIRCFSLDFQLLGFFVAELLSLSKLDIYKGKGLMLANTTLILKAGKQR